MRRVLSPDEIDFDKLDLAVFKDADEAESFRKRLLSVLDSFLTKYDSKVWAVSIKYQLNINFGK